MVALFMLGLQGLLAIAGLLLLRSRINPSLGHVHSGELLLDVWLPLSLVIPLLFFAAGHEGSVRVDGWPTMAGPIAVAVLGVSCALLFGRGGIGVLGEEFAEGDAIGWRLGPRLMISTLLAGLVLLLLGAAHVMSIWIGQCTFALAAILLWLNTPELPTGEATTSAAQNRRAGVGMFLFVLCAVGQGGAGWLSGEAGRGPAVLLMLAFAAGALMLIARQGSAGLCLRVGAWAGSVGVLFGLGLISIKALVERTIATYLGIELAPHSFQVASGFGAYAFDATLLMILTPLALGALRLPPVLRGALGVLGLIYVAGRSVAYIAALAAAG